MLTSRNELSRDFGNMPGLRRGRKWYCDVGGTRVGLVKCRETSELLGMSSEQVGEDVGAVTRCEGCSPYNCGPGELGTNHN